MSKDLSVAMSLEEAQELYVILSIVPEDRLTAGLTGLRDRIEQQLYHRLSIDEMEALVASVEDENRSFS